MQRTMRVMLALLAIPFLAGCTEDDTAATPPAPVNAVGDPATFAYPCPAGTTPGGQSPFFPVCRRDLESDTGGQGVAAQAVSPVDGRIMVLARYGVELTHVDRALPESVTTYESNLLVTHDAGQTWSEVFLPGIPTGEVNSGLPGVDDTMVAGLAFGPDGVLHVFGGTTRLAFTQSVPVNAFGYVQPLTGNYSAFHIATADLGATWGNPSIYGSSIYQWFSQGTVLPDNRILAIFGGAGNPMQARLSADSGTTWTEVEVPMNCEYRSRFVRMDDTFVIGCTQEATLIRFDPVANAFLEVGALRTMNPERDRNPQLSQAPHGGLALNLERYYHDSGPRLAFSADGGASWGRALEVLDLCRACDGGSQPETLGFGYDAVGNIHYLLDMTVDDPNLPFVVGHRQIHLVLGLDLQPIHEQVIYDGMASTWTPGTGYAFLGFSTLDMALSDTWGVAVIGYTNIGLVLFGQSPAV